LSLHSEIGDQLKKLDTRLCVSSANRKCALSSASFRRVQVPLALK
jgi:hypothetical protein